MPLNLNDLMKKARDKAGSSKNSSKEFLRPWQTESVLYQKDTSFSESKASPLENSSGNQTQTKHKPDTNQTQIRHKPNTELKTLEESKLGIQSNQSFPIKEVNSNNLGTSNLKENNTLNQNRNQQDKLNTNQIQTKHKLDTNITPNHTQTKHKLDTNQTQLDRTSLNNQTQIRHKPNTKLNTQKTQIEHKPNTNLTQNVSLATLIGVQRTILFFVFEECKKARSHVTEPISIKHIADSLNLRIGSIKTSVVRLCEKKFLDIHTYKIGRGGWSSYSIHDDIYKELLRIESQHKLNTNLTQIEHKPNTKPNTELNTTNPSSSSYIKTTTTNQSNSWSLDIEEFKKFGFNHSHLNQVISMGLKEDDVKRSLVEFSFDFDNKHLPRIQTSPVNLLMGLFRKGQVYISSHFQSEEEKAIQEMVKRAEERKQKMIDAKFMLWFHELSEEEKHKIQTNMMPSTRRQEMSYGLSDPMVKGHYMKYFNEQING